MNVRVKPYLIIRTFKKEKSVSKTARMLGIHCVTVYRWIKRAHSNHSQGFGLSERNLVRKSTRPHTIHKVLSPQDEANIVSVRIKKGYTAEKIKKKLSLSVSVKTVHRTLKRYNLIDPDGYHRRPKISGYNSYAYQEYKVSWLSSDGR